MRCRQPRMQRIMTVFLVFCLTSLASFGQGAQSGQTSPAENTDTSAPASESDPSGNPPANAGDPNTASTPNLAGTPNPAASTAGYVFPSNRQIVRFGYRGVAGIRALAGSAFTASWNTWVDTTPREWHRDASGWGKRFGTSILDHGINQSALVARDVLVVVGSQHGLDHQGESISVGDVRSEGLERAVVHPGLRPRGVLGAFS